MQRVGILLQARMGSSRLPGKVLKPLAGKPMIGRILDRLAQSTLATKTVVLTSDKKQDDVLADYVKNQNHDVFRGSELDVLDRYYQCAKSLNLDHIVRATGDNPFVDCQELDRQIAFHVQEGVDYTSNFPSLGGALPFAIGVETMRFEALETSWVEGKAQHHREHVNEYIQENPQRFTLAISPCPADKSAPELGFTVDTPEQFEAAQSYQETFMADHDGDSFVTTQWLIQTSQGSVNK